MYVYTPNKPSQEHLNEVIELMKGMGSPTIRCVNYDSALIALEGSHRLEAARQLGIDVNVEIMDEDEMMEHDHEGLDSPASVADILNQYDMTANCIKFDYDQYTQVLSV
jgi:hypothetical protein